MIFLHILAEIPTNFHLTLTHQLHSKCISEKWIKVNTPTYQFINNILYSFLFILSRRIKISKPTALKEIKIITVLKLKES
jgi:hypothetical protein